MYEELVKRLRNCATQAAPCKTCDMVEDGSCTDTLMKQAADAIEELQRQIDAWVEPERKALIKSLPRWIPVTERLPEVDLRVLTFARFKGDGSWFMDISSFSGVTNHGIPTFWGYGEGMVVTHWMPLPEPPKEET